MGKTPGPGQQAEAAEPAPPRRFRLRVQSDGRVVAHGADWQIPDMPATVIWLDNPWYPEIWQEIENAAEDRKCVYGAMEVDWMDPAATPDRTQEGRATGMSTGDVHLGPHQPIGPTPEERECENPECHCHPEPDDPPFDV